MILMDCEATDLMKPMATAMNEQPYLFELCLWDIHDTTLKEVKPPQTWLIKPPVPIPPVVTKITGMTTDMVAGAPSFIEVVAQISDYVLGARMLVAHNIAYDVGVLSTELKRVGCLCKFPWPPQHYCTMENSQSLFGKWPKLSDLYAHYNPEKPISQSHRAEDDVRMMQACLIGLRKDSLL